MEDLHNLDWIDSNTKVSRLGGVKALFEAPRSPEKSREITNRLALYADTIIFSGTLLHGRRTTYEKMEPRTRIYYLIASALGILKMKDLFLADVTPPIAVIAEPTVFFDPEVMSVYDKFTKHDALKICSEICKKDFSSMDGVNEFILAQEKLDNLKKGIKIPDLFWDSRDSFVRDIEHAMGTSRQAMPHVFGSLSDPNLLLL